MNNQTKYFHHVEHRKFQNSSKTTLWLSLIITLFYNSRVCRRDRI